MKNLTVPQLVRAIEETEADLIELMNTRIRQFQHDTGVLVGKIDITGEDGRVVDVQISPVLRGADDVTLQ